MDAITPNKTFKKILELLSVPDMHFISDDNRRF